MNNNEFTYIYLDQHYMNHNHTTKACTFTRNKQIKPGKEACTFTQLEGTADGCLSSCASLCDANLK